MFSVYIPFSLLLPRLPDHPQSRTPRRQDSDDGVKTAAQELKMLRRKSGDYSKELEQKEKSRLNKHIANSFKRLSLGNELGQQLIDDDDEFSPTKTGYDWSKPIRHSLDWEAEKSIFRKEAKEEDFWKSIELKPTQSPPKTDTYEDIQTTDKYKPRQTPPKTDFYEDIEPTFDGHKPRYQISKVPSFKRSLEEMRQQQTTLDRAYQKHQDIQEPGNRGYKGKSESELESRVYEQYQVAEDKPDRADARWYQQYETDNNRETETYEPAAATKMESPRQNISYQTSDDSPRYPNESLKYLAGYEVPTKADENENELFGLSKGWKSPQSPKNPEVTEFKMADAGSDNDEYNVTETADVSIFDRKVDDANYYETVEVRASEKPSVPEESDQINKSDERRRSFEVMDDVDPFGSMNQSAGSQILINQAPKPFDPSYSAMKKPKAWKSVNLIKNEAASRQSWSSPNRMSNLNVEQTASRKSWSTPTSAREDVLANEIHQGKLTNEKSGDAEANYEPTNEHLRDIQTRAEPTNDYSQGISTNQMPQDSLTYEKLQYTPTSEHTQDRVVNQKPWHSTERNSWSKPDTGNHRNSLIKEANIESYNSNARNQDSWSKQDLVNIGSRDSLSKQVNTGNRGSWSKQVNTGNRDSWSRRVNTGNRDSWSNQATGSRNSLSTANTGSRDSWNREANAKSSTLPSTIGTRQQNTTYQDHARSDSSHYRTQQYAGIPPNLPPKQPNTQPQQPSSKGTSHYDYLPVRHRPKSTTQTQRPRSYHDASLGSNIGSSVTRAQSYHDSSLSPKRRSHTGPKTARPRSYHDSSHSPTGSNKDYIEMSSVSLNKINKLEMENRISRSFSEDTQDLGQGQGQGQPQGQYGSQGK